MEDFVVRPATERDLDDVLELWRALDEHQRPWRVFPPRRDLEDHVRARYRRSLEEDEDESLLVVAEAGGRVVGAGFGHPVTPSSLSDQRAFELSGVVVEPGERRRGVGLAVVRVLARFAAERGFAQVVVRTFAANEGAMRFWEEAGFVPRMVQLVAPAERLGGLAEDHGGPS